MKENLARAIFFAEEGGDGEMGVTAKGHPGAVPQLQDATAAAIHHIALGDGHAPGKGLVRIALADANIAIQHFHRGITVRRFALIDRLLILGRNHCGSAGRGLKGQGSHHREHRRDD